MNLSEGLSLPPDHVRPLGRPDRGLVFQQCGLEDCQRRAIATPSNATDGGVTPDCAGIAPTDLTPPVTYRHRPNRLPMCARTPTPERTRPGFRNRMAEDGRHPPIPAVFGECHAYDMPAVRATG
jgi:hypothetical protein